MKNLLYYLLFVLGSGNLLFGQLVPYEEPLLIQNTYNKQTSCQDAYGNWHNYMSTCATCGTSYCVEYLQYGEYCSQGCCRAIENYPSSKCGD